MAKREHLASYLDDFARGGAETAYVYARGLRTWRMSYGELARMAWRTSRWLLEHEHLTPGDRVILWGPNTGEWAAAFWGCLAAGIVAVPLDAQSTPEYVCRIVAETEASLLLYDDDQHAGSVAVARRLAFAALEGTVAQFTASAPSGRPLGPETLAQIIYTSGSTASPKGVCLTHGNTLASLEPLEREIAQYLRWERPFHPVRFLVQLPLSHVFGQMLGLFIPPLLRGEMHFVPELSPAEVAETIHKRKISVMVTVPRYLEVLGAEMRRGSEKRWGAAAFAERLESSGSGHFLRRWWLFRDIHQRLGWKFWAFVCGGASLPEETEQFWHRMGYAVIQGYGMTETASLISVNHPFKMSRGSIGKSMPGREIRIAEGGEILVRGQNVSPGYWRKEGGLQPLNEDSQWFSTGDLADVDEAGNLFFRGRRKELIVAANGMNIVPEDLEEALRHDPGVRDAVVVGVDGSSGPEPFAFLLAAAGSEVSDQEFRDALRRVNARLASHQQISRWALWPDPDFPRTSTRKVKRGTVREAAQALTSGKSVDSLRSDAFERLLASNGAFWAGDLSDEMNLGTDLGLDSLGRVQLLAALEGQFQVRLDESQFTEQTRIGDVRRMLENELGSQSGSPAAPSPQALAAQPHLNEAARGADATRASSPSERPYPFANWPSSWWASAFRQLFNYAAMRPITRLLSARARVVGAENLRALDGPALLVANHLTSVDGALLVGRLPWSLARRTAIAMSGEMLRGYKYPGPSEAWYWKLWLPVQYLLVVLVYHVFPLPRTSGFRRAFQHAGHLADKGYSILVFPEGTRSYTGEILSFQQGIGILAKELRLPVIPIRLKGIHELRQEGRSMARSGDVSIHVGAALRFGPDEEPADIAKKLQAAVRGL